MFIFDCRNSNMHNCYLGYLIFFLVITTLFYALHCTSPPLPRYVDEKSPLHSWMNAAARYTIEVAAYKRRQKAKSKTDNGPRDFVSNRINRCRGTIQPQRHVTCSTRGLLDRRVPPFVAPG